MKKQTAINIKLGIFVLVGFALFIVVVYYITARQQLFNKTFRIYGTFSDVSGLLVGNNVRFSGITVGTVESITITSDTTVRVVARISEDTRRFIKKDAEATIGNEGLMGNKILIIMPGTPTQPEIEDNDMIATTPPLNMDRALVTLKTTGDNVVRITGDLADIVHTIREGKSTIGQLFMDTMYLKQARDNLTQTTGDFAAIAGTIRQGKSSMGRLLMDSTYFDRPLENVVRMTGNLSDIVSSVRSGHGLAGRLLMDSATAFTFDTTLTNLKQTTINTKNVMEKAKRSFLLWGF